MSEHSPQSHAGDTHASIGSDADRRRLALALGLIVTFMVGEVTAGILAHSLTLLADAAHMLTDAGAIGLSLVRGARAGRSPSRWADDLRAQAGRDSVGSGQRSHATRPLRADPVRVDPPAHLSANGLGMDDAPRRAGWRRRQPARDLAAGEGEPGKHGHRRQLPAHRYRSLCLHRHARRGGRDPRQRLQPRGRDRFAARRRADAPLRLRTAEKFRPRAARGSTSRNKGRGGLVRHSPKHPG